MAPMEMHGGYLRYTRGPLRLLVLACSQRKVMDMGPLPAWDLYDGVLYRVCKKAKREGRWPDDVRVRILSAEYLLIEPEAVIAPYDRRMDKDRAEQFARGWRGGSGSIPEACAGCRQLYIAAGGLYRDAIQATAPEGIEIIDGSGEIGQMQQRLKAWLAEGQPAALSPQADLFAA